MKTYELVPRNGRKSFCHKALITELEDKTLILYSYGTPIIAITPDSQTHRLWDGWTATTGTHIRSFCGLAKKEFLSLKVETNKLTFKY